jgi:hypothetical protein
MQLRSGNGPPVRGISDATPLVGGGPKASPTSVTRSRANVRPFQIYHPEMLAEMLYDCEFLVVEYHPGGAASELIQTMWQDCSAALPCV